MREIHQRRHKQLSVKQTVFLVEQDTILIQKLNCSSSSSSKLGESGVEGVKHVELNTDAFVEELES